MSHDIPFADGWCGTIDLTLTAVTELLVGGERKRGQGQPGEVHPVRLPDGRHAIPDTALQGMIRQVLEIATFGKLGPRVQDRRYAVRDISSSAHQCSTHTLLANSSPEHVTKYDPVDRESGKLDLASLIFGATGGHKGDWFARNLKRRAAFEWATTDEAEADEVQSCHNVVLSAPKNSYYPASVRQPSRQGNRLRDREVFASYADVKDAPDATLRHPELAGSKIRPTATASLIRPVDHQVANNQLIQTKLHAVAAGTRFKTRLHVHNLRSAELGALLWALDFDGNENTCHRLGMGKPFGMGAVRISLKHVDLTRNDGKADEWQTDCRSAFKDEMAKAMTDIERQSQSVWVWGGGHPAPAAPEWKETVQVKALVKAAMPSDDAVRGYMNVKTYAYHKKNGRFLEPYADKGWELARREPIPERGSAVVGVGGKTVQPRSEGELKAGDRVSHLSHGEGIIERLTATDVFCRLRGKGWRAPRGEVTRC